MLGVFRRWPRREWPFRVRLKARCVPVFCDVGANAATAGVPVDLNGGPMRRRNEE